MALAKIQFVDKVNANPIKDREKQSTAEDWNEVKSKVNVAIDEINQHHSNENNPHKVRNFDGGVVSYDPLNKISKTTEHFAEYSGWVATVTKLNHPACLGAGNNPPFTIDIGKFVYNPTIYWLNTTIKIEVHGSTFTAGAEYMYNTFHEFYIAGGYRIAGKLIRYDGFVANEGHKNTVKLYTNSSNEGDFLDVDIRPTNEMMLKLWIQPFCGMTNYHTYKVSYKSFSNNFNPSLTRSWGRGNVTYL